MFRRTARAYSLLGLRWQDAEAVGTQCDRRANCTRLVLVDVLHKRMFIGAPAANEARIHDCAFGLRYLRHKMLDAFIHSGTIRGRSLEHWRGLYWLDYEPEESREYVN